MFIIEGLERSVDNEVLKNLMSFRATLWKYVYSNTKYLDLLKSIIEQHIETIQVDTDYSNLGFVVKVKKTAMAKKYVHVRFIHNATFYYPIIDRIMHTFLTTIRNDIYSILVDREKALLDYLLENIETARLICIIKCINKPSTILRIDL